MKRFLLTATAILMLATSALAQTPVSIFGLRERISQHDQRLRSLEAQQQAANAAQIAALQQQIAMLQALVLQQQQPRPQAPAQPPTVNHYHIYQGPRLDPNPGTPKLDPNPGVPRLDLNPGAPKLDPTPGAPKLNPSPGPAPKLDPNPGPPAGLQRLTVVDPLRARAPMISATIVRP